MIMRGGASPSPHLPERRKIIESGKELLSSRHPPSECPARGVAVSATDALPTATSRAPALLKAVVSSLLILGQNTHEIFWIARNVKREGPKLDKRQARDVLLLQTGYEPSEAQREEVVLEDRSCKIIDRARDQEEPARVSVEILLADGRLAEMLEASARDADKNVADARPNLVTQRKVLPQESGALYLHATRSEIYVSRCQHALRCLVWHFI
jgi:hypothetical protein